MYNFYDIYSVIFVTETSQDLFNMDSGYVR